jgi:hypothetical protein
MIGDAAADISTFKAPLPKRTRQNQAATFQEWIDSVYRQLAPAVQSPFSPENPPSELGNAKPLVGRPALSTATTMLVFGLTLLVSLVIAKLIRDS